MSTAGQTVRPLGSPRSRAGSVAVALCLAVIAAVGSVPVAEMLLGIVTVTAGFAIWRFQRRGLGPRHTQSVPLALAVWGPATSWSR